jgi:hypothetical protein
LSNGAKLTANTAASHGKMIVFVSAPGATPTPKPATPTPKPATPTPAPGAMWHPAVGITWQWQLTTPVDTSMAAQVFDIDGFDNSAAVVTTLHGKGAKVVCYISAGSYENYRPDAGSFPSGVLGRSNGWPGEKWLDIRDLNTLGPIMSARLDMCKSKGFDAVEVDNIDGYQNATGFPLTSSSQATYNQYLANAAHARSLAAFMKNDSDQVTQQVGWFDGIVVEQCFEYDECDMYQPFITAGKPVLEAEYSLPTAQFCSDANTRRFSAIKKDLNLTATRATCW